MVHESDEEAKSQGVEPQGTEGALPPIDFSTFIVSLRTSAMMHLGHGRDGGSGEPLPVSLPLAKQSIDLIELLQVKTRGNLTEDEERLLAQVLFDLRTQYVAAADRSR